jgi:hypothetical protein
VASAIDAIMGILPQALFCSFNNGYCHGYSLFLKPYFALQQWIPAWVFILPQTLFGIAAQAHLVYLVSAICLVTKGQERRASTK